MKGSSSPSLLPLIEVVAARSGKKKRSKIRKINEASLLDDWGQEDQRRGRRKNWAVVQLNRRKDARRKEEQGGGVNEGRSMGREKAR